MKQPFIFRLFLLRVHAWLTGAAQACVNDLGKPVPTWAWLLWG